MKCFFCAERTPPDGAGRGVSDGLDVVAESGEAVGADCACGCFGSWWSGVEKG